MLVVIPSSRPLYTCWRFHVHRRIQILQCKMNSLSPFITHALKTSLQWMALLMLLILQVVRLSKTKSTRWLQHQQHFRWLHSTHRNWTQLQERVLSQQLSMFSTIQTTSGLTKVHRQLHLGSPSRKQIPLQQKQARWWSKNKHRRPLLQRYTTSRLKSRT